MPARVKRGSTFSSAPVAWLFHTPMRWVLPSVGTHPGLRGGARDSSTGDEGRAGPPEGMRWPPRPGRWDHRVGRRWPPERWMALAFAAGSACFLIGPFPGYVALVGPRADALTFFVGSVLFTVGGALQVVVAAPDRQAGGAGAAAWRAAVIQFAGTLFFNVTT